ncbi:MAG: cytochrome c oxidase assembly factor 1 family protein [Verrucomicrobiota bacterium]|nr:cytochrome c oxidase assembly factor 1 family protein [Verrucomicrobiota bacterium]
MDQATPPPVALPPRPGWWSRNWKWFVPVGCLSFIAIIAVFVTCIIVFVFSVMKSTDVYKTALNRAKANPEVVAALGTPIKDGLFVSGNTHADGASGEANLSIPISGPKGSGTVYVVATKVAGRWNYSTIEAEISGKKDRIDLNQD